MKEIKMPYSEYEEMLKEKEELNKKISSLMEVFESLKDNKENLITLIECGYDNKGNYTMPKITANGDEAIKFLERKYEKLAKYHYAACTEYRRLSRDYRSLHSKYVEAVNEAAKKRKWF